MFSFAVSFWILSLFFLFEYKSNLAGKLAFLFTSILPPLLYHFSLRFPKNDVSISNVGPNISITLGTIFGITSLFNLIVEKNLFSEQGVRVVFGPLIYPFIAYFIYYFVYIFVLLWKKYKKAYGIQKQQLRYLFWGVIIFAVSAVMTNLILPVFGITQLNSLGPAFSFIMLGSITYSISKHRLLDIRFVITRSVIYGLLLSLVTLLLVFAVFLSGQYFGNTYAGKIVSAISVAIIIVFGLDPFKLLLSNITDKIFFKAKINYQAILRKLSETLNYELDQNKLIRELRTTLRQELKLRQAATLLRKTNANGTDRFEAMPELLVDNPSMVVRNSSALVKYLRDHKHVAILESLERKIEDSTDEQNKLLLASKLEFERMGMALAYPIFAQGHLIAILVLGPKLSGDSFSNEDLNLIEVLGPQIGSAIQKANLFQEVKEFSAGLQVKVEEATTELRERNTSLTTLQTLTKEITKNLDFNTVVQEIADAVANKLGYMGAILVFLDDDGVTVRARAVTNTPLTAKAVGVLGEPFQNFTTRLDDPEHANLAHQVLIHGEIMMSASMAQVLTPPIPRIVADGMQKILGIKTMVLVPINTEGKTIGCIEIGVQKEPDHISRQELDTMQSMADELGVVARNLRLFAQIQNTNRKLEDANRHLQQLDQAKSEFVSIASHQLRTPMTGIKGYLSMLADGDFGKLAPEHVKIMRELLGESDRMIRLINQFLNVSKIEAGKFTYAKVPVKLDALVEQQVNELTKVAADKKLKLEFKKPRKALPTVIADPDKLEDVVLNLVDNAIKYTPSGGKIQVSVSAGPNEIEFCVKDSGIGIKSTDAPELFNKFVRGSGIAQIHPDGSGLGLFIAKSIIDAHGGRVWAESDGEGKGSSFKFTLPLNGAK